MSTDDPRTTGEHVRWVATSGGGEIVLAGVVHDHPASVYRVRTVVETVEPDVLALELPPLAVPLFERYAESERSPPRFGGEMSAAIQAATDADVVGVDGPTVRFLARLYRHLSTDGASLPVVRRTLRGVAGATRHAAVCRIAAGVAARTSIRMEVDDPVAHDCRWHDDPHRQAADEREQVRRARAITRAFGHPDAVAHRNAAREAHMASRLSALSRARSVVGVVGIHHLDPLTDRLEERA
jgi:pheromone shutdown protein TraB